MGGIGSGRWANDVDPDSDGCRQCLAFMRENDWNQAEAASNFGVSAGDLSRYLHGKRKPSIERALHFEAISEGKISALSWFNAKLRPR